MSAATPPRHRAPLAPWLLLAGLVWQPGCGDDPQPLLRQVEPLNRATAVDITATPRLLLGDGAELDPTQRRLVLYDVTNGGRITVPGGVELEGGSATYLPSAALETGHDFELVLEAAAVGGSLEPVDRSEPVQELVSWPYVLRFRTGSRPRVRCAYLEPGDTGAVVELRFSQPMNPLITGEAVSVRDLGGSPLPAGDPLWIGTHTVRLPLDAPLDPVGLYVLQVDQGATAEDGTTLDGDDDGVVRGAGDSFSLQFTGSQRIIRSRLRQ